MKTEMLLMSWDKLSKGTWGLYEGSYSSAPENDLDLHFSVLSSFAQCWKYIDLYKDEGNAPRQPSRTSGTLKNKLQNEGFQNHWCLWRNSIKL